MRLEKCNYVVNENTAKETVFQPTNVLYSKSRRYSIDYIA